MFGSQPNGYMGLGDQSMLQAQPDAAPPKSGMFGGNVGNIIAAALSGYVSRQNPELSQALMQQQMMKQRRQQELDDYNRKRADDNADFVTQLRERAQYAPKEPHYFQDNSGNEMAIGPDGQPQVIYKDPNPWKLVPNGMGGVVPVNMDVLMHGGSPGGAPAPGTVVDDPRAQGGPTQPASGGFLKFPSS